ncbi:MAG: alpha/beta hydrolase, partial [Wenzhouxiangella sp.]|nr:alpha/beta hydrolase [Wenzhouxiangella sp.]
MKRSPLSSIRRCLLWLAAAVAVASIAAALTLLDRAGEGTETEQVWLGPTPVTVYRPDAKRLAEQSGDWEVDRLGGLPVVVIAHGFAGSQQLMQAYALTLARNGYIAVSFDFYGHGRNLEALSGDVTEVDGATRLLVDQTGQVIDYALALPGAAPALALLGHSMASDIIVRQAASDPRVRATVAVSLFSPAVTAESPDNLLVIVGNLEGFLKTEALRVVGLAAEDPQAGVTYGDFKDGSARRAVFAPAVEHVGVLYSPTALSESAAWLNHSFGRAPDTNSGPVDPRGLAIPLLLAGLVLLAWPLSRLLPRAVEPPAGLDPRWR